MSNDLEKTVGINIVTKADGKAIEQTGAAMGTVAEKTSAATVKIHDYATETAAAAKSTEELAAAQKALPSTPANRAYGNEITGSAALAMQEQIDEKEADKQAKIERQNSLLSQQQAIHETFLESLQAEIAGDTEKAQLLRTEVEMRQVALQLQRQTTLGEEEAMAVAEQQVTAERQIVAQKEAQAALNRELVAQEEAQQLLAKKKATAEAEANKVHGRGGRIGSELQNFGVDSNVATSAGIGVLAGMEVFRLIEEQTAKIDEQRIALEKESEALAKQARQWHDIGAAAKSADDLVKMNTKVNESLNGMLSRFREIKGESGWFDGAISIFNGLAQSDPFIGHIETSTEQAQTLMSEQIAAAQVFADTMKRLAKENVDEINAMGMLPLDERIDAYATKIIELRSAQEGLNTSTQKGQEQYARLETQIETYLHLQNEAYEASARDQKRADERLETQLKLNKEMQAGLEAGVKATVAKDKEDANMRRKEIANELSQLPMSDDDASAAARDLNRKRDLQSNPRTAEEERRNRLYQQREGLRGELYNLDQGDARSQRESDLLKNQETQRRFQQQPAEARIAGEALDAVRGKATESTASGSLAAQIKDVSERLLKGDKSKGGSEEIYSLMQQFLEAVKANHQTDQRADTRFQQIGKELELIRTQMKNAR